MPDSIADVKPSGETPDPPCMTRGRPVDSRHFLTTSKSSLGAEQGGLAASGSPNDDGKRGVENRGQMVDPAGGTFPLVVLDHEIGNFEPCHDSFIVAREAKNR